LPARVLLAEEETLVREGLRLLLEGDFRVVGTVADAESLRREARRLRPDVAVAGLRLLLACPAGALSKAAPGVAFVVLASERDDARADLLPLDVSGWVRRSSTALDLREAVQAAAGTPGRDAAGQRAARGVTPRASEVVRLLARGKPMKEVAADLGISARTVAFHKYKTMRALGLDSSAALVRYAVRNHML
jgi:DNA-binding NarL/FixJ family response regulator